MTTKREPRELTEDEIDSAISTANYHLNEIIESNIPDVEVLSSAQQEDIKRRLADSFYEGLKFHQAELSAAIEREKKLVEALEHSRMCLLHKLKLGFGTEKDILKIDEALAEHRNKSKNL